mmetsp:Transcript_23844/g.32553  ORF Transcript_23844/g.32553 Transcript_23844/m.32553 type:complete len:348 (+) Transcript_23844:103-1146(+)
MVKTKEWRERLDVDLDSFFDLFWANESPFLMKVHQSLENFGLTVTDWVPEAEDGKFCRICFYTLQEPEVDGGSPTQCTETQRYHFETEAGNRKSLVIQNSVTPNKTLGSEFRIESEWKIENQQQESCLLHIHVEVECLKAPIWGVGGMIESALLSQSVRFHDQWVSSSQKKIEEEKARKEQRGGGIGAVLSNFVSEAIPKSLRFRRFRPTRSVVVGTEKVAQMFLRSSENPLDSEEGTTSPQQEKKSNGGGVAQRIQEVLLGPETTKDSDGETSEDLETMLPPVSRPVSPKKRSFPMIQEEPGGCHEITEGKLLVLLICVLCCILFVYLVGSRYNLGVFEKAYFQAT